MTASKLTAAVHTPSGQDIERKAKATDLVRGGRCGRGAPLLLRAEHVDYDVGTPRLFQPREGRKVHLETASPFLQLVRGHRRRRRPWGLPLLKKETHKQTGVFYFRCSAGGHGHRFAGS